MHRVAYSLCVLFAATVALGANWHPNVVVILSDDQGWGDLSVQDDMGSTIELSLGDSRLTGKIKEARNPPEIGAEHDRFQRKESYVNDFRPLRLGTIDLKKGKGTVVLKALDMPGSQVMEFRG